MYFMRVKEKSRLSQNIMMIENHVTHKLDNLNPQGSTDQNSGSCDKKCSGSVSGFELTGERHIYTLDFSVKKGKVALKDMQVTALTTTTQPSPSPPGGSGSGASSSSPAPCPSGFRQVCSMVGSCPMGSKPVCPPGREESGQVHVRSAADCRCVPFFLLGDLDRGAPGAQLLERLALKPIDINIEDVKLKLGSKTCTCSFLFTVTSSHEVVSSSGRCDKKCNGKAKGVEVTGSNKVLAFDLTVKKGKVKITNPTLINIFTTSTTTTTTPGHPQTTNSEESTSMPSTDSGCLCVDQGPSTQGQLTFNETGQTHVQEQIFIEETGILGNFLCK